MRRPLVIIIIIVTISLILYLTHRYLAVTYHQCYVSTAIRSEIWKLIWKEYLDIHIFAFVFLIRASMRTNIGGRCEVGEDNCT